MSNFGKLLKDKVCPVCGATLALVRPNVTLNGFVLAADFFKDKKDKEELDDITIPVTIAPSVSFLDELREHYQSHYCFFCKSFYHVKTGEKLNPFADLSALRDKKGEDTHD